MPCISLNATTDDARNNLRKAAMLLKEAGWEIKNGVLTNKETGQQMKVEFLLVSPMFERLVQPYLRNLERLGIKGALRLVDSAQYTRRINVFDYDIVVGNFARAARFLGNGIGRPRRQHQSDWHQ